MAVIEVNHLTKRFGRLTAVEDVTFAVERATVVGFLGPNGAGKTTTLRILLGLVAPTSGTATINGRRYADLGEPLHVVGAALESSLAYPGRSARNHLRIAALAGGVRGFSLGMHQRLALATAMLCDPEILILDEPANGLDPEGVHWLRTLLRNLASAGRTVLVSSHILAEVAQTVDSVVILDHGRLVTQATLAELTAGGTELLRIRTPRAADLAELINARSGAARVVAGDRIEVTGTTSEQVGLVAAEHAIPIFETTNEATDLEHIFLSLTAGHERK
jgi:ABC-2 type transport system ATP-binding protein